MRFQVTIELKQPELPNDFRRLLLSLMKTAMTMSGGNELRNKYFETARPKPFAAGVFLPKAKFAEKTILSEPQIRLIFSTDSFMVFGELYNSFNAIRSKEIVVSDVSFTVKSIVMVNTRPIETDEVTIKLLSPLLLREHDKQSNIDRYYTCKDTDFEQQLRLHVAAQLDMFSKDANLSDTLRLLDLSGANKTVLVHYGMSIPVTIGRLRLHGDIELLEWLHQVGMGSRRSAFFGLFDWEVGS